MMDNGKFRSAQEAFWAGDFGDSYISRNTSQQLLASNLSYFSRALRPAPRIASCIEFGANVGMNLKALQQLYPSCAFRGVEINGKAATLLGEVIGPENVFCGSILDYAIEEPADLSFTKGVLIHIDPDLLPAVYDKLYEASRRYIMVGEYYSPSPATISYRGHSDRLYKRDFAGEILDRFKDLRLVDYGFCYRRDPAFPQDDITWFLMEKAAA